MIKATKILNKSFDIYHTMIKRGKELYSKHLPHACHLLSQIFFVIISGGDNQESSKKTTEEWLGCLSETVVGEVFKNSVAELGWVIDKALKPLISDFIKGKNPREGESNVSLIKKHPINSKIERAFFNYLDNEKNPKLVDITFFRNIFEIESKLDSISHYQKPTEIQNKFVSSINEIMNIMSRFADKEMITQTFSSIIQKLPAVKILQPNDPLHLSFLGSQYGQMSELCMKMVSLSDQSKKSARDLIRKQVFGIFDAYEYKFLILEAAAKIDVSKDVNIHQEENQGYYDLLIGIFQKSSEVCSEVLRVPVASSPEYINVKKFIEEKKLPLVFRLKILDCLVFFADKVMDTQKKIALYKDALDQDKLLFHELKKVNDLNLYSRSTHSFNLKRKLANLYSLNGNYWEAVLSFKEILDIKSMKSAYKKYLVHEKDQTITYKKILEMAKILASLKMFDSSMKCAYEALNVAPMNTEVRMEIYKTIASFIEQLSPVFRTQYQELAERIKGTGIAHLTLEQNLELFE